MKTRFPHCALFGVFAFLILHAAFAFECGFFVYSSAVVLCTVVFIAMSPDAYAEIDGTKLTVDPIEKDETQKPLFQASERGEA